MHYRHANAQYDGDYSDSYNSGYDSDPGGVYGSSYNTKNDGPQPEDIEYAQNDDDFDELDGNDTSSTTIKLHDHVDYCPNCKMPITSDMDSCPYCGDILYRYFRDASFMPHKGLLAKIVAVVIITLIVLAVLGWLILMVL